MDVGTVIAKRYEVRRVLEVGARSTLLEAIELETDRARELAHCGHERRGAREVAVVEGLVRRAHGFEDHGHRLGRREVVVHRVAEERDHRRL